MLTIKFPTYIHIVGRKNYNYFLDTLEVDTFFYRGNDKELNFNEIFEPLIFFDFKEQNFKKPVIGEMPKLGPKTEIYHDQGMITKNNVMKIVAGHSIYDFLYSKKSKDIIGGGGRYFSEFDELSEYEYSKISFEYFWCLERMIRFKHPSHLINTFGLKDTKKLYEIQEYLLKNSHRGVYNCLEDLSEHIHKIFNDLITVKNLDSLHLPYIKGRDIEKFYSSYENSNKLKKSNKM